MYRVGQQKIDAFEEDGVVPLRQLITAPDLARLAEAIEEDIRNPGPFYHGIDNDK